MIKLVIMLVFLNTPGLDGAEEKTVSFGSMGWNECHIKKQAYVNMYESMPGVAVIRADCEPMDEKTTN